MAFLKNTSGQYLGVYAYDKTTGLPKTGDAANITAYIRKDTGSPAATNDVNPTEVDAANMAGWYEFTLTQAETNAERITLAPKSTTANVVIEPLQVFTEGLTVQGIVNGVWDELVENHENADTMGYVMTLINNNTVALNVAAGVWNAALPGFYTAGQAGYRVGTFLDAPISGIPTANQNADALLKRDWTAVTGEAARSVLNALRMLRNRWGVAADTLTVYKEDDSTTAWTAVVTDTAGADPITEVDPS